MKNRFLKLENLLKTIKMQIKSIRCLVHIIFVLLIISVSLVGCKNSEVKGIQERLKILYEQELSLPIDSMIIINNQYVNNSNEVAIMSIVSFVDSTLCSTCAMDNLYDWRPLIDSITNYDRKVDLYFIFDVPKDIISETVDRARIISSELKIPIYLDTLHIFMRENKKLNLSPILSVLTLDENNRIKIVGNPVYNKKIYDLFWEETENHKYNQFINN